LYITESRQQIQCGEFEDELGVVGGLEEEYENEFYQKIYREKYKKTVRKKP